MKVASGGDSILSEIISHKKIILTHLFLQRLQCFRAQIPRELLGVEWQRIFDRSLSRQSEGAFNAMPFFRIYKIVLLCFV